MMISTSLQPLNFRYVSIWAVKTGTDASTDGRLASDDLKGVWIELLSNEGRVTAAAEPLTGPSACGLLIRSGNLVDAASVHVDGPGRLTRHGLCRPP